MKQDNSKNMIFLLIAACSIIALLLFTIILPLLINWAFKMPAICDFLVVDWEAKDVLSYYGDVLGFIGTVIFSVLALWQNHIIKTESDKHTKLLEDMEKQKNMPILYFGASVMSGNCCNLGLYIENISDNIATDIYISNIRILNEDGSEFWDNKKEQHIPHLKARREITLKNPGLTNINQYFAFHLKYQDKFGEIHDCNVEGKQVGMNISFPKFSINEISE